VVCPTLYSLNIICIVFPPHCNLSLAHSQAASVVAPVTTVIFFLFAGYIIPRGTISIGWRWFHYLSFLTYPFRGLVLNEFAGRQLTCTSSGSFASFDHVFDT
jgi:ABC-type multidrug transport system permease subunit